VSLIVGVLASLGRKMSSKTQAVGTSQVSHHAVATKRFRLTALLIVKGMWKYTVTCLRFHFAIIRHIYVRLRTTDCEICKTEYSMMLHKVWDHPSICIPGTYSDYNIGYY
jgi:hypothetical protein